MLPFKDISYAQGAFNMDTDSDPIVAMKASGDDAGLYLDSQLVRNYADAIRLGKVPILYHFAGGGDPVTEANYFIAAVSPYAVGDVYALDWEVNVASPVEWVNTFVTHFHAVVGAWPLVYMDISRREGSDWSPVLNNCGLWIAAPSFAFTDDIPGIGVYVAQQGPIVNGVDTDMWFGTIAQLKAYGYHTPAATPPPPPVNPPEPTPVPPTPVPDPTPVDPVPVNPDPSTPTSGTTTTPVPPVEPTPVPTEPKLTLWQKIIQFIRDLFN